MEINKIKGLIAAPFTPMNKDSLVNLNAIKNYANKLKTDSVKGVFVCGTTGEGMGMTIEERKQVAETWVKEQTNDFIVIVHIGTTSTRQSHELAEHAQGIGAYATGSLGCVFPKPGTVENLVDFCAEMAAGAPDIPFYYYHMPNMSGVDLPMVEFLKKAPAKIPNLAGIKYTHNNLMEFQQVTNLDNGKWDILSGYDELLLAGISFGAKGAVGSTYNFMAPLYNRIIDDYNNGCMEDAKAKQLQSVKIIELLFANGVIPSGKAIMKSLGVDCGDCRPPLGKISTENYNQLIKNLEEIGFYDTVKP